MFSTQMNESQEWNTAKDLDSNQWDRWQDRYYKIKHQILLFDKWSLKSKNSNTHM